MSEDVKILEDIGQYKYGFHDPDDKYAFKSQKGLNREVVEQISHMKGEPQWMLDFRLKALDHFLKRPMPNWGPSLKELNLDDIYYYVKPTEKSEKSWDDVPDDIKRTFDKLGVPEAERKFLAGLGAQYESEMVYHSIQDHLEKQGVIFLSIEDGLRQHPDLFREYFSTVVPIEDNKFAALNSAVWSGGSFVYVPKGVKVDLPLQAYFRLNTANVGQFERTLIIVDEGASVHYVEGCFLKGARVRTRNGEKPIEDIQVDDEVMTHQGRYRRVYHTQTRPYHGKVYNIRFYGDSGRELNVTAEHPLLVVRRERQSMRNKDFQLSWSRADSVKEGDYLAVPVPQPVMGPALTHSVTVPLGRGRHIPVYREVNLPIENRPRQNGQTLVLSSTEIARTFAREFGPNVYEKHIPSWVSSADAKLLAELVKGMWRGDGSYDPKKNMFRYNTVSVDLAYAFRDACVRLGVAASVNMQERFSPRKNIYTVVIASPFNPRFGEIVGVDAPAGDLSGSPFVLDDNFMYLPIKEIAVGEMETEVYNFSVEEDESYVAEGVVSHNCTAPQYTTDSFHSGVIEIVVKKGARVRYTTIQNWSTNVYNLVTQRALVNEGGTMEWVDANLGCLTGDTAVFMNNDVKPIREVEPGDMVYSLDADMQIVRNPVIAKKYSGQQQIYRLQTENYREIRATANHPFLTLSKQGKQLSLVWKRLDQLQLNDWVAVTGEIPDHGVPKRFESVSIRRMKKLLTLPDTSSEDVMWLLGIYIGDGYVDGNRVYFAVQPSDRVHTRLVNMLADVFHVDYEVRGKVVRINFSDEQCDQPVHFSIVSAIESQGVEDTWDLEIANSHNFIANGLIVHNSKLTMKYPSCYLLAPGAHGEILSMAFAGPGQHQDAGGKIIHFQPHTSSKITSKSISKGGGRTSYRGLLKVYKGAEDVKSNVVCDALLLDPQSRSDTYPYIEIDEEDVTIGHEASVSKVGEEQLFYLMSRGLSEEEATTMVVSGFIEPLVKELPMEYAIELNRLIQLQMEGSIG